MLQKNTDDLTKVLQAKPSSPQIRYKHTLSEAEMEDSSNTEQNSQDLVSQQDSSLDISNKSLDMDISLFN